MPVVRVRQHVNPLSQKYQQLLQPLSWEKIYAQPDQPLYLDLGCARGRFLLQMAQLAPECNFLGLEIRQPLVDQANQWRDHLGLMNLAYVFGNANIGLRSLLPPDCLQGVMIQFPDPWFKRRHQKRRLVQPELVQDLARCLKSGGFLFLQSDVEAVVREIRDRVLAHPDFYLPQPGTGWLSHNPLPVASERERSTIEQGLPVYRVMFSRR